MIAHEILHTVVIVNHVHVVGLSGELGVGKTAFVKALAKELGIIETVTSPTFGLLRTYHIPQESTCPFSRLAHIDAYRLEKGDDLHTLGWGELVSDPSTLICIEWPEQVVETLPENILYICIEHVNETTRKIMVNEQ